MKKRRAFDWFIPALAGAISLTNAFNCSFAQTSQWVSFDSNGQLVYKKLPKGDRIMDFSHAGYVGGGVALPDVPVRREVKPSGGDDTASIQAAIDEVSALAPLDGFRGAVLLGPGKFNISNTLRIAASSVVVRGAGPNETIVNMTGPPGSLAFEIAGSGSYVTSNSAAITNLYVPSGTSVINVTSSKGFEVADNVLIGHPVTQAWVHFMGMDTLLRDGTRQTWLPVGSTITTDRTIKRIEGNTITLDVPLTDSFDSAYLGTPVGTISKYTFPGRISQVGLEHLMIQAPKGTRVYKAVVMDNLIDGWLVDVIGQETQNAFRVRRNAKRITLDHVANNISVQQTSPSAVADFVLTGTQILLNKGEANSVGTWPVTTGAAGTGPIVVLNFTSKATRPIEPHQRWTTGFLMDNSRLPNSRVKYVNRGTFGTGHGWATGWSVAWNDTASRFTVSAPPGAQNWCIGCVGAKASRYPDEDGIFDSLGTPVLPGSLYLAQLCERLGPDAAANVGYPGECAQTR